ncbi:MAG: phosphopentomutase [Clostridia bacterium]|nr:phosphopentomutase [Clostridia bacterium]
MKRVFLIVLDSFGIGNAPDAAEFADKGANTIKTVSASPKFATPNMRRFGLFNIDGVDCGEKEKKPAAAYGRYFELSKGKDTVSGHWEIAGVVSEKPMHTYPDGFPPEVIAEFERLTGRKTIVNKPYSGTQVIAEYGKEHVDTGALIIYTSADSVFQIAAHEDVVPLEQLYEYCRIARKMLTGEHAVGRVIARPFVGTEGNYTRTPNRHDFALLPPEPTMLDDLKAAGREVIAVGKINDIFAGSGVTDAIPTKGNTDGIAKTLAFADRDFEGLCFVNLVDFDMLYGHRNDIDGYAAALTEFDSWLDSFLPKMRKDDVLMITADHGCDPGYPGTDHTREAIPLLMYGRNVKPRSLGTHAGFDGISRIVKNYLM